MSTEILLGFTFIVALLECFAIIGLLLPGVALLFFLSASAASESIPFWSLNIMAFLGAFIGDSISFWLGRNMKPRLLQLSLFQKHHLLLKRTEKLTQRFGALALLIGRFVGPLRPFMPISAGFLNYPQTRFLIIAIFGSFLWAPAYIAPGYFLGKQPGLDTLFWLTLGSWILLCEVAICIRVKLTKAQSKVKNFIVILFLLSMIILLYFQKDIGLALGQSFEQNIITSWIVDIVAPQIRNHKIMSCVFIISLATLFIAPFPPKKLVVRLSTYAFVLFAALLIITVN